MLTRISKIKNVRNYHNFSNLEDFTKKNVIYALNGSGKTNLSRFLNTFSQPDLTKEYFESFKSLEAKQSNSLIEFEIFFNQDKIVNHNQLILPETSKMSVYNKDFLDKNISIDNFSNKIHTGNIQLGTIGSNQIEIKRLEKELERIREEGLKIRDTFKSELYKKATTLQKNTNGKLNTFTDFLNYENFKDQYISNIANKEELKKSNANFELISKINEEERIKIHLSLYEKIDFEMVKNTILQSFKFEEIENEIETHIIKTSKRWVEDGLRYYKERGDDCCPFCRQSISALNIIRKYNEYIESRKAKTIALISDFREKLAKIRKIIQENSEIMQNGLLEKVNSYLQVFDINKYDFKYDAQENLLNENIKELINYLYFKENNIESLFTEEERQIITDLINLLSNKTQELLERYINNNSTIDIINRKLQDTGNRKSELRKQMAKWMLIDYYDATVEKRSERESLLKQHEIVKSNLEKEKEKAPNKEKKELIVKLLNKTLTVAGLNKYYIDESFHLFLSVTENNNFDISKETNLVSEGEKTVIGL